jgi:hypothetical protein
MDRPTELRRLAKLLHREAGELGYLATLDATQLMQLRRGLQETLIERFAGTFRRLASGGRLIPDALNAKLCTGIFGAALTANLSYFTPIDQAVRMAKHFDDDFLTDIARHQVPERAQELLAALPVEIMRGVTRKLLAAKEFAIMGGFTDYLPEEKAVVLINEIHRPVDRLHVSAYAQRKDRIARIMAKLDDEAVQAQITAAATEPELMSEIALTVAEMPDAEQQRLARISDKIDAKLRPALKKQVGATELAKRMAVYFSA